MVQESIMVNGNEQTNLKLLAASWMVPNTNQPVQLSFSASTSSVQLKATNVKNVLSANGMVGTEFKVYSIDAEPCCIKHALTYSGLITSDTDDSNYCLTKFLII